MSRIPKGLKGRKRYILHFYGYNGSTSFEELITALRNRGYKILDKDIKRLEETDLPIGLRNNGRTYDVYEVVIYPDDKKVSGLNSLILLSGVNYWQVSYHNSKEILLPMRRR